MSKKIDFKKDFKKLFLPPREPVVIKVPKYDFLMVDGQGAPKGQEYQDALMAIYSCHFTIKFTLKFAKVGPEYTMPPLDTLWWLKGNRTFDIASKEEWFWTAMLMQPKHITQKQLKEAIATIKKKEKEKGTKHNPALGKIKLGQFEEGLCVQIMHIGPYSAEEPTIRKLHQFALDQVYKLRGKHHELYLSDPRRTKPDKLKTVIRQPVKK